MMIVDGCMYVCMCNGGFGGKEMGEGGRKE